MAETTPTPPETPETPCLMCQDPKKKKMAVYGLASIACDFHKGEMQEACLKLITPLEDGSKNVDEIEVLADIMGLGDNGQSIAETAELFTTMIEAAAQRAADKHNAAEGNPA